MRFLYSVRMLPTGMIAGVPSGRVILLVLLMVGGSRAGGLGNQHQLLAAYPDPCSRGRISDGKGCRIVASPAVTEDGRLPV